MKLFEVILEGKDLAETESCKQSTNDSDTDESEEDTDNDSFINDSSDPGILTPSPKPKTKTQGITYIVCHHHLIFGSFLFHCLFMWV